MKDFTPGKEWLDMCTSTSHFCLEGWEWDWPSYLMKWWAAGQICMACWSRTQTQPKSWKVPIAMQSQFPYRQWSYLLCNINIQGAIIDIFLICLLCKVFYEIIDSHHISTVSFGIFLPCEKKVNMFKRTSRQNRKHSFAFFIHSFSFVLTELWQEALISRNNIIIKWKPGLNDTMDETADCKPAHSQTPPCAQLACGSRPTSDQPGHQQKHSRHRKQEDQNLWHGTVIGHIGRNQEIPWPVGMKVSRCWYSIHSLQCWQNGEVFTSI